MKLLGSNPSQSSCKTSSTKFDAKNNGAVCKKKCKSKDRINYIHFLRGSLQIH
jgi:hypothetical protein